MTHTKPIPLSLAERVVEMMRRIGAGASPSPWTSREWVHESEVMNAVLGAQAIVSADSVCPAVVWGGIRESAFNAQSICLSRALLPAVISEIEMAIDWVRNHTDGFLQDEDPGYAVTAAAISHFDATMPEGWVKSGI